YNPQRHLAGPVAAEPEVRELLRQREQWVMQAPQTRQGRRERFAALRQLAGRLRNYVAPEEEATRQALEQCEQGLTVNSVLRRRDYAACLYPEGPLRAFCTRLLRPNS